MNLKKTIRSLRPWAFGVRLTMAALVFVALLMVGNQPNTSDRFRPLSVEEREIVLNHLDRMGAKFSEADLEGARVIMGDASQLLLKKNGTLEIAEVFFAVDTQTQQLAVSKVLAERTELTTLPKRPSSKPLFAK